MEVSLKKRILQWLIEVRLAGLLVMIVLCCPLVFIIGGAQYLEVIHRKISDILDAAMKQNLITAAEKVELERLF